MNLHANSTFQNSTTTLKVVVNFSFLLFTHLIRASDFPISSSVISRTYPKKHNGLLYIHWISLGYHVSVASHHTKDGLWISKEYRVLPGMRIDRGVRVSAVWPSTRLTNKLEFWLFGPQLDKRLNVRALAVWPSARLTNKLEFWLFGPQLDKQLNVRALAVWPSARLTLMASELWLVGPQFDLKQLASELWLFGPQLDLKRLASELWLFGPQLDLKRLINNYPVFSEANPKYCYSV